MFDLAIPDIVPYLLAILGLLLVWEVHNIQARAGRIKTADTLSRSGIRLFLHVTPDDSFACAACRQAHGTAFHPSLVATKKFRPIADSCTNPAGCRCQTIALFGAWPEAQRVQIELPKRGGRLRLSSDELAKLLAGAKTRRSGVAADRLSLVMLEAMQAEGPEPIVAIERYREVIDGATAERDLALVVPAYLRLSELLDRTGQRAEALSVVDEFLKRYHGQHAPHQPTEAQLSMMSLRKTRLMTAPSSTAATA